MWVFLQLIAKLEYISTCSLSLCIDYLNSHTCLILSIIGECLWGRFAARSAQWARFQGRLGHGLNSLYNMWKFNCLVWWWWSWWWRHCECQLGSNTSTPWPGAWWKWQCCTLQSSSPARRTFRRWGSVWGNILKKMCFCPCSSCSSDGILRAGFWSLIFIPWLRSFLLVFLLRWKSQPWIFWRGSHSLLTILNVKQGKPGMHKDHCSKS